MSKSSGKVCRNPITLARKQETRTACWSVLHILCRDSFNWRQILQVSSSIGFSLNLLIYFNCAVLHTKVFGGLKIEFAASKKLFHQSLLTMKIALKTSHSDYWCSSAVTLTRHIKVQSLCVFTQWNHRQFISYSQNGLNPLTRHECWITADWEINVMNSN